MANIFMSVPHQKSNKRTTNIRGLDLPFKRFNGIDYNFWSTLDENMAEFLAFLHNSEVREDDVFICTYPRSGTNWTNQIVHMLLTGSSNYAPEGNFLELSDEVAYDRLKSPRVFVTHWPYRFLPAEIKKKGKIICVLRNPKDIAVSLCHFIRSVKMSDFTGSWDDFFRFFCDGDLPGGSWFDHVKDWERAVEEQTTCSILTLHYEDMKTDQFGAIEKIAKFLGVSYDSKHFSEIAAKCEFKALKKEKCEHVSDFETSFGRDPNNHFLYRRGEIGDWKNWFTVSQNEKFESMYKEQMKDSKLSLKYLL